MKRDKKKREMEDWYHAQHADFLEHGGIRLLNGYYNGSHAKAVMEREKERGKKI
jgi:hypothetical protein